MIQTYIRNTDLYLDIDLEKIRIILSNQWFSLIVMKVSQKVANNDFIDEKTSLQIFIIFSIIPGVSPAKQQPE